MVSVKTGIGLHKKSSHTGVEKTARMATAMVNIIEVIVNWVCVASAQMTRLYTRSDGQWLDSS